MAGSKRALTLRSKSQRSRSRSNFSLPYALVLWRCRRVMHVDSAAVDFSSFYFCIACRTIFGNCCILFAIANAHDLRALRRYEQEMLKQWLNTQFASPDPMRQTVEFCLVGYGACEWNCDILCNNLETFGQ